nr:immunoglobulin light chain junction region [Macaca mulatta]MOV96589.1 immunoglobulin light chain junction region [Macaca mulatta]MOV97867.1 immunoglobulin light chain junction region [Macaca mulatta]MOV98265.1 immunoglobulin light chain junction region [Macaca mulatta]MOV98919.1 immunoglobulin light chain junction region [Macaca mulatta]
DYYCMTWNSNVWVF